MGLRRCREMRARGFDVAGGCRCRQGVTAARPDSGRRARRWRTAQRLHRSRSAAEGWWAAAVRESVAAADDQPRPTHTTSDDQPRCNGGEQRRGSPPATPTPTRDLLPLFSVSLPPSPSSMELHHQPRRPASPSDALRRCGRWAPSTAATRPRIRRASRRGDDAHTCNNATCPASDHPLKRRLREAEPTEPASAMPNLGAAAAAACRRCRAGGGAKTGACEQLRWVVGRWARARKRLGSASQLEGARVADALLSGAIGDSRCATAGADERMS